MTEDEKAFLAQVALGWFTVTPVGTIWRNIRFHGGGISLPKWIKPERAERSEAGPSSYLRIMFNDMGTRRKAAAHRIVWMVANQKDIPSGMEINHEDGDKRHNHPNNLSLVTHAANAIHSVRVLGNKPKARYGEANSATKLTARQVAEIRGLLAQKSLPQREIARRYGITQSAVSAISTGRSWA